MKGHSCTSEFGKYSGANLYGFNGHTSQLYNMCCNIPPLYHSKLIPFMYYFYIFISHTHFCRLAQLVLSFAQYKLPIHIGDLVVSISLGSHLTSQMMVLEYLPIFTPKTTQLHRRICHMIVLSSQTCFKGINTGKPIYVVMNPDFL